MMILYKDIPKYCDLIDRDKQSSVLLSKFQSRLYKRMIEHKLAPLHGFMYFLDIIIYASNLLFVLIFARNLLLLAFFHRQNHFSLESITFGDVEAGKVEVTFNSNSEQ